MKKIILFAAVLTIFSSCVVDAAKNVAKTITTKQKHDKEIKRINTGLEQFNEAQKCKSGDPLSCVTNRLGKPDNITTQWYNGVEYIHYCYSGSVYVIGKVSGTDTLLIGTESKPCGQ
jgi:hypothetical protein